MLNDYDLIPREAITIPWVIECCEWVSANENWGDEDPPFHKKQEPAQNLCKNNFRKFFLRSRV